MIGLSLTFCIADIINGVVNLEDVEKIIANTAWTDDILHAKVEEFCKLEWRADPALARQVFWELWNSGRIEQPRLSNHHYHINIAQSHWKYDMTTEEIVTKIKIARKWARKHFNTNNVNGALIDKDLNLLPPSFFVTFPDADTMEVSPNVLGKKSSLTVCYRLAFYDDGRVGWIGRHPFYDYEMSPLIVEP